MTRRADTPLTRADFHAAGGVLLVTREPPPAPPPAPGQPALVSGNPLEGVEILLAVWDDGSVTALNGHVDLGTGIRTALGQIVAEELDVALASVNMVLGDTTRAPNQGATIASASIQIHAVPLRAAAAQARAWLVDRAAGVLQVDRALLTVRDGLVSVIGSDARSVGYGALVAQQHVELSLALDSPLKSPEDYRIVGTSAARVDIPAKATGALTFVHDMRVPGMLHGRVVRPPYAGADHGDFIGNTLESVDESSIAHIPGIRAVVVIRDFIGIVAEREEHAEQALRELRVQWKPWPGLTNLDDLENAIRANPATQRKLINEGDVDAAMAGAAQRLPRNYVWPYQMHGSIGPSCALADWQEQRMTVWAGSQNPHVLRADLSRLMGLADTAIDVIRMEAAGCYGRNCADDVAADAALLSRAVGAPVRVQLTREQEHAWEPKGAAQLMQVNGGLNADGSVAAYDFQTSYPSNGAPTLALLLTRTVEPVARAYEMGDRSARPPYDYENLRVSVNDMPPMLRASWLRGVSALPNSFAHESYIDELATAAGVDPVEFRLRYLSEPRAAELLRATADRAGWKVHTQPQQAEGESGASDIVRGQGVAYARYVHSKWPGYGAAWAAWVADVEVNRKTGEVQVRRVVVGHDAGTLINPAGVQHQIHGNVVQTTSRALTEQVSLNPTTNTVASLEWGSYPILSFRDVPVIEVVTMARPGEPPLGAGESASVPGTAAIANAIFDATGVRFRQPPFTAEVVRAALQPAPDQVPAVSPALAAPPPLARPPVNAPWPQGLGRWSRTGAMLAGVFGLAAALLGWRPAIAPVLSSSSSIYTAATIERGRQLAAAGDCVVCHTAPGGTPNAGGRAMETPFGKIFTTNLTPDAQTGIGLWSFSAFQRAMREGISRDGHHLYPAFPYTAFAKTSDEDLTALYAYLMAQPAVRSETPATQLAFPFNVRPLMAAWNAMFHDPAPYRTDPTQTVEWNRGAYLVNGLGHCGACHTPRNALGAERGGQAFLSGAVVDGWEAPALTALSRAPVPWSSAELYRYLRNGYSLQHGAAAGPMGPVVKELGALPDDDIRAMASYLTSFNQPLAEPESAERARQVVLAAQQSGAALPGPGQRLFNGACASCHHDGDGPKLLGVNTPLALNSKLQSERPDNLIRVILEGIRAPATAAIGFMPAFQHSLDDDQIATLASYMRSRYAPGQPAWKDLPAAVSRLRATAGSREGVAELLSNK
ncbi:MULTISPECIES: molybdopterin cofactor-binding domain-containing protein [unclassified Polaromonas]|jgi:nicotinate dehydrogenase subunit B|uniref:molybdopterin cofactor-binding domain-containing protein n=1 Tax=unclassified Polaromonas TaxID=2638319 RepID=UPI000BD6C06E|nr:MULTISPECIES: molybdopterin cofactor-binding domain-containing protein [unclassified Polaromonas]OYY39719.1 MAG: aldehyde dehydrogenase [Polaromonas sp. 35-63-35]OYZ22464.1 MAG: aldehyde dehydrogenase [Polaromonas sp. 16-63-31]OYZ81318.1 MAG: aldehyde dehydrogenase [Polaromonas sp. 24-63-21]OZA52459.1 MAG: aldehyde dehydrogenase [Polaromonas sp. 17-63-33]OZA88679.1 MAG: aldehyde dehydrogenase [Polaromonas sp. 39-63-25]